MNRVTQRILLPARGGNAAVDRQQCGIAAAVAWVVVLLGALSWAMHDCGAPAYALPRPDRQMEDAPTVDLVERTIECQVRGQARGSYLARAERSYRPEQIRGYAEAGLAAVRGQRWPAGHRWHWYVPLLLATVDQQSRWVADAVSRWNRDPATGERILVDRAVAWRRADRRLDYGLCQIRWSAVGRWRPGTTLADLRDPATGLVVGAQWLARRAATCSEWVGARTRPRCRMSTDARTITCRCLATWRAAGALGWAGSTETLVRTFVPATWRCLDGAATSGGEEA